MDAVAEIFAAHGRKITTAASVVLVIVMSLSIANAVLFFVENLGDEAITPRPVQVHAPAANTGPDVNLAGLNLFGRLEEALAAQVVDAPETQLNLELQGVFTAEDPDESTAIVAERSKTGELFRIGERLPGNAILEAVYIDHILIKRGGRVEKLAFSDATLRQQFRGGAASAPGTPRFAPTPSPELGGESSSSRLQNIRQRIAQRRQEAAERRNATINARTDTSQRASVRDRLDQYRERMRENPQAVLSELGVSPVSSGEAKGYRISGDIPEAALQQAGLRQGDVILSVNGQPVGNVVSDQAMIDQAMNSGRVRVEVQRADRRFYLTVPVP